MAKDHPGWYLKYQVDLNAISNVFEEITENRLNHCSGYKFNILLIVRSRNEEEDESFMILEIPGGKVVCYDLVNKSVKKLWEFTPIGYKFFGDSGLRCVHYYTIESLASV